MGRPTKLTPELQSALIEALSSGAFIEAACEYVGIDPGTYHRWMAKGAEEDADPVYGEFREAIKGARAAVTLRMAGRVLEAADDGSWQAGAWWLERSFPDQYGRRTNLAGPNGGAIEVKTDDAEREDRLRQLVEQALNDARSD
jgi:hypothetical protein